MKYVFVFFFCTPGLGVLSQAECNTTSIAQFRASLDQEFAAILTEQDKKDFTGLDYYPFDNAYRVWAQLKKQSGTKPFGMQTTTARRPLYIKYGELTFVLKGRLCRLGVYQYVKLLSDPVKKNFLFLAFKDSTSGNETYGGGKYLDIDIPDRGDSLLLDFNESYHPYCAYNHQYSCPVVPSGNVLRTAVRAGVKYSRPYPTLGTISDAQPQNYAPNILLKEILAEDACGKKISGAEWKGKILVINFWATWCGPCIKEFADFEAVKNKYRDKVDFIMLSDESMKKIAAFKSRHPYQLNMLRSRIPVETMGLTTLPATYFYNSKGEYITKHIAPVSGEKLAAVIQQMLAAESGVF